jgi:3-oxoacyl-[acyl-carrier-protein] synthase II
VTPCGTTVESTWQAVVAGRSGISTIRRFPVGSSARAGGMVPGFEEDVPPGRSLAMLFGDTAVMEALGDAGLDPHRDQVDVVLLGNHGERTFPNESPNEWTALSITRHIAATAGARSAVNVYGACAAGALAIGSAAALLRAGKADIAVAGGVDALLRPIEYAKFAALGGMSVRDCEPYQASCPFDARRDGFVLSEGAGFVVLETAESARRRGVEPKAVLEGSGCSQNAYHVVASPPDGLGPALAMQRALTQANRSASEVGYINAHGTGTQDNDACETTAIKRVFGEAAYRVPVSSTKGVMGHTMAAAGAIEFVLSVKVAQEGVVPPTANWEVSSSECDLDYVPGEARRDTTLRCVLTNSFGFGGQCASLLVGAA